MTKQQIEDYQNKRRGKYGIIIDGKEYIDELPWDLPDLQQSPDYRKLPIYKYDENYTLVIQGTK